LPKKTTDIIIASNNDYVIGVKGNQPTLQKQVKSILTNKMNRSSLYSEMEVNKGRTEYRCVTVSDAVSIISNDWKGLKQVVSIHRITRHKGKIREENAYFISSLKTNALEYAEGIRSHWEIENSLHWVKDVTLKEDASKIIVGNAPENISTIKNIAINIFRRNEYKNIANGMRLVANDIKKLMKLIK
jgi:predicted transposase YbfD/YdcC